MILPAVRDSRLITIRRGGTLTDEYHSLLAIWAAECAGHVLRYFEEERTGDERPRKAIEAAGAWARREISVTEAKNRSWEANNAARGLTGAAKFAALAAGQAAVVAHVAAHDLGAAAYAIRAVMAANEEKIPGPMAESEWVWQTEQLPAELKTLVLEDQKNRNALCWNVFHL